MIIISKLDIKVQLVAKYYPYGWAKAHGIDAEKEKGLKAKKGKKPATRRGVKTQRFLS